MHTALLAAAVHPHPSLPFPPPNLAAPTVNPRDSITLHFVRAVSHYPPRIPVDLRNAVRNAHSPDRFQHLALLTSLTAYYDTLVALLALEDDDTEVAMSHPSITEPSEFSLPSTTSSVAPSTLASSAPRRLAHAAKYHLHTHVADVLRMRMAKHAGDHLQRTSWLSDIPQTRRAQDDYVHRQLGFVPLYLQNMHSTTHRAVFIYILLKIMHSESAHGVSPAIKNLVCFVLARSSENSSLTAHSAFLAHRFGASPRQLYASMNVGYLRALHRVHAQRADRAPAPMTSSCASSSSSSSSSSVSSDGRGRGRRNEDMAPWRTRLRNVRRKPRAPAKFLGAVQSSVTRGVQRIDTLFGRGEREGTMSGRGRERFRARASQIDELSGSRLSTSYNAKEEVAGRIANGAASEEDLDLEDVGLVDDEMGVNSSGAEDTEVEDTEVDTVSTQLFDVSDNPAVPDVHGLNTIDTDEFDGVSHSDVSERVGRSSVEDFYSFEFGPFMEDAGVFHEETVSSRLSASMLDEGEKETGLDESNPDETLLSEMEVIVLLVAHDVAQAWRRNSRISEKFAEATAWPLLSTELAGEMHRVLSAEGMMETMATISAFCCVQRWSVWFEERGDVLEAAVRRFMKGEVGKRLDVASVGQRCMSSEFSECLRGDCRSLKLPRHAVVTPAFQQGGVAF